MNSKERREAKRTDHGAFTIPAPPLELQFVREMKPKA
jgi:hypothetical protein